MFETKKVEDFLMREGMHPACIELDTEIERFKAEMAAGLAQQGGSSILMVPTYIDAAGEIPQKERAIVIDAGGTNLRIALVQFDDKRAPVTEYFENYEMPGSVSPVTKEEMFDQIAARVAPILGKSDKIGFCFSYVFESTPQRDGILTTLSKEVDVSGIEGARACEELEAAFQRRGADGTRRYVMLNDTVATLLGAKAVHGDEANDGYVGLILGTGQNACFVEHTKSIQKLPADCGYTSGTMIINMESGVYTGFQQGSAEKEIDDNSLNPGDHMYEKMMSGGYYGDILYATFKRACAAGLFSKTFCDAVKGMRTVNLREITEFILNKANEENVYERLAAQSDDDRHTLNCMLDLLYERVARLLAVLFCSIAEDTDTGANEDSPLRICAEGTTYYRSPLLLKHLDRLLQDYVKGQRGRNIQMVKTANATLVGTALAALIN